MSGKLPALTGAEVIRALERAGFAVVRVRSNHHFLRHPDGRRTVMAAHAGKTIGPGLLSKILRDFGTNRKIKQKQDLLWKRLLMRDRIQPRADEELVRRQMPC
jgi:predicted RNA binding protein YcfA (HicA-like mRNA interferase family)